MNTKKNAKKKFYKNIICKAKEADPNGWYQLIKRISNYDQGKSEVLQIDEISHLSDQEQVEEIAKSFNRPSQTYKALEKSDIDFPPFSPDQVPRYTTLEIKGFINKIKTNKSTIPGDIPAKILKKFSDIFCIPLTDIINTSIKTGFWPSRYKQELITPVAKVTPTGKMDQLRPISNLPVCDKIFESVISELVVKDMKKSVDPKQFGNQKDMSIQHYLVQMMHRILSCVDSSSQGEATAVLCSLVDWKSAYSYQCTMRKRRPLFFNLNCLPRRAAK